MKIAMASRLLFVWTPMALGAWVAGLDGESCSAACARVGGSCNSGPLKEAGRRPQAGWGFQDPHGDRENKQTCSWPGLHAHAMDSFLTPCDGTCINTWDGKG